MKTTRRELLGAAVGGVVATGCGYSLSRLSKRHVTTARHWPVLERFRR